MARGDCRCARWAHWFGGERNSLCAQRAQLQNSRNSHLTQGAGEIFLGERAEQLLRSASVATEGSSGWMGHMAEGVPILRPHHLHFASPRGGHDVPVLSLQNKIDPLSGRSYAGARRSALGVAGRRVSVWRSRCCWACGQSHMKRWQFVLIYLAPVSYTHLDVYKRQGLYSLSVLPPGGMPPGGRATCFSFAYDWEGPERMQIEDVYKRQA